jgi:hypothetical protein
MGTTLARDHPGFSLITETETKLDSVSLLIVPGGYREGVRYAVNITVRYKVPMYIRFSLQKPEDPFRAFLPVDVPHQMMPTPLNDPELHSIPDAFLRVPVVRH